MKMSGFKKNPKVPFEIKVPNKIRKRIAMHEKHKPESVIPNIISPLKKILSLSPTPAVPKQGSLWSRFTNRVKKLLGGQR